MKTVQALEFTAPRDDNARLANLCGPLDENLRQIEQALDVTLARRGHRITIRGRGAKLALAALENFYNRARDPLSVDDIQLALVEVRHTTGNGRQDTLDVRFRGDPDHPFDEPVVQLDASEPEEEPGPKLYTRRADLRGRTPAQREYLKQILSHDVTLGIGPAGTGKTYLAVACAVDALERDQVKRIVLTRPAVEAGERLGFLPGDLAQKVDPYLRPLYDALYDLLGFDKTAKM
ncbi:PhoH family protein, partial [Burkholderia sp.]